jgi:hypothetical protein
MKTLFAYLLAFLIGPTVGAIASLPLLLVAGRVGRFLSGLITGFVAFWFGTVVFSWLGVPPGIGLVMMLLLGFALNDLRRVRASIGVEGRAAREIAAFLGDVSGIVLGALWLL